MSGKQTLGDGQVRSKIIAWAFAAALLFGPVASPAVAAPSLSARASAHVAVKASVILTVVDADRIDVRSNVPWRLSLETTHGTVEITGPAAPAGVHIRIPGGSRSYWLMPV